MTPFEKQILQIAGLGVWQIVTGQPMKKRLTPIEDPRWETKNGVFVTLKKDGAVRGSIGMLESTTVLAETLFDAAGAAATHDQRFKPIESNEIKELEVGVTLLSEVKPLKNPLELKIGKMGVIISRGENRGVLLPQIAVENNWSAEQFLEACCEKAGLSHKAWKDPNTLVEYFTSQNIPDQSLYKMIEEFV